MSIKFIHHMKDGSVRDSIDGVVIRSEEFYQVMADILEKRAAERGRQKHGNQNMAHSRGVGRGTTVRDHRGC